MVRNDLNKQTKQVGLQIGLASCSMHKWMKGNVWHIKNVKRVSVKPEKKHHEIFEIIISEIFHEIFQGKKFMKFYITNHNFTDNVTYKNV